MAQIHTENGHLFIEVPEGFFGYSIIDTTNGGKALKITDRVGDCVYRPLPPGSYTLVGLGSELTEEQWKEIIEDTWESGDFIGWSFRDYSDKHSTFDTATESGLSLLKSKSLSPNTTVILKNNDYGK